MLDAGPCPVNRGATSPARFAYDRPMSAAARTVVLVLASERLGRR